MNKMRLTCFIDKVIQARRSNRLMYNPFITKKCYEKWLGKFEQGTKWKDLLI